MIGHKVISPQEVSIKAIKALIREIRKDEAANTVTDMKQMSRVCEGGRDRQDKVQLGRYRRVMQGKKTERRTRGMERTGEGAEA